MPSCVHHYMNALMDVLELLIALFLTMIYTKSCNYFELLKMPPTLLTWPFGKSSSHQMAGLAK